MIERREPRDDDELFRLYQEIFGDTLTEGSRRRWRWQYLENPAQSGPPEIWVARQGDALLGQYASMPVRLAWGGREVRASWGMDVFVRAEARGQGVGVALFEAWGNHADVALGLGLTPSSYGLFRKLRYRDVGPVAFYQRVMDPAAVATRRLGAVLGRAVAPILGLTLRSLAPAPPPRARDVEIAAVTDFDEEYDELWHRAAPGCVMSVRRDRAYLAWKYRACPHQTYDVHAARRNGRLAGFVVTRVAVHEGAKLGWIVDLFTETEDQGAQDGLLADTLDRFRRAGVVRAQCFGMHGSLARALGRHGFFAGRSPMQFCVQSRVPDAGVFERTDAWHVVFGDSDMDRS